MPSKKYCTYSKQRKDTVEGLKDSLIELKHDITKIHQKLKSICREIYFLYDAIPFSESSEESEEIEEGSQRDQVAECYQPKNRKVKHRRRPQIID